MDRIMKDKDITQTIIGCAMKVHRKLGFGFLESVYHKALLHELGKAGLRAESEKPIPVFYDGMMVGDFFADILVEQKVIVELKAVEQLSKVHEVQTVNYLAATGLDVGLLLNFGTKRLEFKRKFRIPKPNPENPVNPV